MNAHQLAVIGVLALAGTACAGRALRAPELELRFLEATEDKVEPRFTHHAPLNAILVADAQLKFRRASELLKEAETADGGGDPMKLMRAARTLAPGPGVVLFGTLRANETSGGATTGLSVFQLALGCAGGEADAAGELRECRGYLARATRQWPAEVYDVLEASVTLIPEGGAVRGRLRLKTTETTYRAELDGEFAATVVELEGPPAATASAGQ